MFTQIRKEPLTTREKKKLKLLFKSRLILGLLFLPLLLLGIGFPCITAIKDIISKTSDRSTYFSIVFASIIAFLFFRFVVPFYKNSFKNLKREDKLVIDTIVLSATQRLTGKGYKYSVQTEHSYLDSWAITIIMSPSLHLKDMCNNMLITIHCLEDNNVDILYIEKTSSKHQ